ncbi:MAG TPA: hemolysin family protein [Chitinispirillaceae bacterium]|nr:hemolysin family protein [Chitinispirillaceae bacterium]
MAELIIILIFILLNGFFAMSEIAVISARKPVLAQKAKLGVRGAKTALELSDSPNRFLSTIQIGITTVGILMGALGEATTANALKLQLIKIDFLAPYAQTLSLVIVVILFSYLTLIIGELVPKRLALSNPDDISIFISRPMILLSIIATPLIKALSISTDVVLFFLGKKSQVIPSITEEEISNAIELGTKAGLVEPDEQRMIKRVFEFGDRQAHSIMTPRTEAVWLDIAKSFDENLKTILEYPYSRYPVISEEPDNIIGTVSAIDILQSTTNNQKDTSVKRHIQPALFIAEHMTILKVLDAFRQHTPHFAIVIDEYGGFSGIITPYDILQAVVGELPVMPEISVPAIQKEIDGFWNVDGTLPVQEFKVYFNIDEMPDEQRYGTISGFVMMMLGHVPKTGDFFYWNGYEFKVTEMKNHRVNKLQVHSSAQR